MSCFWSLFLTKILYASNHTLQPWAWFWMTFLLEQHSVESKLQLHTGWCFMAATGKEWANQNKLIPQPHPQLRLKNLLPSANKTNLHFYDITPELHDILHIAFSCSRPEATEFHGIHRKWESYNTPTTSQVQLKSFVTSLRNEQLRIWCNN